MLMPYLTVMLQRVFTANMSPRKFLAEEAALLSEDALVSGFILKNIYCWLQIAKYVVLFIM